MKNTIKNTVFSLVVASALFAPSAFAMSDTELRNLLEWRDKQAPLWRETIYASMNSIVDTRHQTYIPPVPPNYTETQKYWLFFAGFSTFESAVNKIIANGVK